MKRGSRNRIRAVSIIVIASFIATILGPNITAFAAESTYNYGEALQKGIMFYEFQRSGKLPADKRDNWRGDSGMDDGKDVGLDLTGGWYDAGDHVKFNLPGAYTAAMLAWSVYEDRDAYVKSGQLKYIMDAIKWETDFLIKCNPEPNVYYHQVGDGDADHKWWGPAEVMQMERPTAKLDLSNPGSAVSAETAAALASAALIFKDTDPDYSKTCLKHAKDLYNFAEVTKSDEAYNPVATKFYKSWSGFYDELSWAATWIYMATGDKTYLDKAESYVDNWGREDQSTDIKYRWAHCWDDVHIGAALLLARITEKPVYKQLMEKFLDYWSIGYGTGTSKQRIPYTPKGLAYLDTWGALRYATTTAFLASVYTDWKGCTADKVKTYNDFAKSQIDYALGSSGRSYVIGYGVNPPEHPHHRTAQGSWFDQMTVPDYHRHILYGALVGGPDRSDTYDDTVANYTQTEVADDYNAGFVGILARMYKKYGGNPIPDFKTIEQKTNDELYVGAKINSAGPSYVEVKGILYNKTGWPARVTDKLSIRYFMDLSEVIKAGCKIEDLKTSLNYNDGATISKVLPWNVSKNIYYVIVDFTGTKIYPGGQSAHRKEAQFRIAAPEGTKFWDNSNDFSFKDIEDAETPVPTKYIPVYENGKFVYGLEPGTSDNPGEKPVIKGDLDGNKVFNLVDILAMKKYVLRKLSHFTASTGTTEEERTAADLKLADFNSDGKINSIDYLLIKKDFIDSTNK